MDNINKMSLNIGYSGHFTENSELCFKKIYEIVTAACVYMAEFNNVEYGFDGSAPNVRFYTNGSADTNDWLNKIAPACPFPSGKGQDGEEHLIERHIEYISWVCDHADIMIIVWNEHMQDDGYLEWELIQSAKRSGIPCVWISSENPEHIFLADKYIYEKFDYTGFKECFANMFIKPEKEEDNSRIFAEGFFGRLYDRFMGKYKAKVKLIPTVEDDLLKEGEYFTEDAEAERTRKFILSEFNYYDREANRMSQKYRSALYMRAALPLLAIIFLSVGLCGETILGRPLSAIFGEEFGIICSIIAGVAFLIHAMINLYAFLLSNNYKIKNWHYKFVYNRTASETLRLLIHILPFRQSLGIKQTLKYCEENAELNINVSTRLYDNLKMKYHAEMPYNSEDAHKILEGWL